MDWQLDFRNALFTLNEQNELIIAKPNEVFSVLQYARDIKTGEYKYVISPLAKVDGEFKNLVFYLVTAEDLKRDFILLEQTLPEYIMFNLIKD